MTKGSYLLTPNVAAEQVIGSESETATFLS